MPLPIGPSAVLCLPVVKNLMAVGSGIVVNDADGLGVVALDILIAAAAHPNARRLTIAKMQSGIEFAVIRPGSRRQTPARRPCLEPRITHRSRHRPLFVVCNIRVIYGDRRQWTRTGA